MHSMSFPPIRGKQTSAGANLSFPQVHASPHMVLVYKFLTKYMQFYPQKLILGYFGGILLQFLKNLSRNLPILCAYLEERPKVWWCLFYNFYSYLEPFGYNGQLKILTFDSGHPSWSGNPENTFARKADTNLGYAYFITFIRISNRLALMANRSFWNSILATLVCLATLKIRSLERPIPT